MKQQTEFTSDGNYNYLRINYGEKGKNAYSYRMIMENSIKGLLPCRERMRNGDTYLYYEIQSKKTLGCRYEMRELDYEALRNLFFYLHLLGIELDKYLLDIGNVVFNEQYIFQDVETGETGFIFLPDKEKEDSFADFMEYIVKKVDHKDSRAVQVSYKLYDLSRREHVSVKEIWALFEKEESNKMEPDKKISSVPIIKSERKAPEDVKMEWEDFVDGNPEKEKPKWKNILISCFLVIAFTILICIKISCKLTYEEETALLAGMVVDAVLFAVHICCLFWNQKKVRRELDGQIKEGNAVIEKELIPAAPGERTEFSITDYESSKTDTGHKIETESYGATVFLEPEPENILYGLGKHERLNIKIDKFPFTIGKMKEEVDYVLRENSISRLHARFYKDNDQVFIMDLNSTNGTCKNGFRIPANQKIVIEEGDELTFGKIRFHYR